MREPEMPESRRSPSSSLTRRDLIRAAASMTALAAAGGGEQAAGQEPGSSTIVQQDPLLRLASLEPVGDYLLSSPERNLPGVRRWDFGKRGGIDHFGTTESVGDGVASRFVFTAQSIREAGRPGLMWNQDTILKPAAYASHKGVSFWVKGDGSSALGSLGWAYDHNSPFTFSLEDKKWHKVFARWEDFDPPVDGQKYHPGFSLRNPEAGRDHYYVIDRIRLFTEETVEPIEPTPRRDLPGHVPAAQFVHGRKGIARTLERLRNKTSVDGRGPTVALVGDSILDAAQLYYVFGGRGVKPPENNVRRRREYAFGAVAGDAVAKAYGFAKPNIVHESFQRNEWQRWFGADAGSGLNWIVAGLPGKATNHGLMQMQVILRHKPDLLIFNLGVNDFRNGRPVDAFFVRNTLEFAKAAQSQGSEIALCTPIPTGSIGGPNNDRLNAERSQYRRSFAYAEAMHGIAEREGYALIDFHAGYRARGVHAVGELCADDTHANAEGHRLMATLVTALFVEDDKLEIWERGAG